MKTPQLDKIQQLRNELRGIEEKLEQTDYPSLEHDMLTTEFNTVEEQLSALTNQDFTPQSRRAGVEL
jgi:hypothetical protein